MQCAEENSFVLSYMRYWCMSSADDYRGNAARCLRVAERTSGVEARVTLLGMAQSWRRLAEQAERNSQNDIVYETPPGRAPLAR
jgi:hypothetical protein